MISLFVDPADMVSSVLGTWTSHSSSECMAILCGPGVGQLCNVGDACGINSIPAGPGNSPVIRELGIGFSSPVGNTCIPTDLHACMCITLNLQYNTCMLLHRFPICWRKREMLKSRLLGFSVVFVVYLWPLLSLCALGLPAGQTILVERSSPWSLPFPGSVEKAGRPMKGCRGRSHGKLSLPAWCEDELWVGNDAAVACIQQVTCQTAWGLHAALLTCA